MHIKKYRHKANLSQKQLAEKVHVSHTTISHYEKGSRRPDPEMLKDLAKALNVTVDMLLNDQEERVSIQNENVIYKSISKPVLSHYVTKIRLLAKLGITFMVVLIALFVSPNSLSIITLYSVFYFGLLLYEVLHFVVKKPTVMQYNVQMDKTVYFDNGDHETPSVLYEIMRILFMITANFLIGLLIYQGVTHLEGFNGGQVFLPLLMIVQLIIGVLMIINRLKKKQSLKRVLYDRFNYRNTQLLYGIYFVLTDILFGYTILIAVYFKNDLASDLYWIYLFLMPVIMLVSYLMYFDKMSTLSKYEILIND
jgi:transcriptional regulator with XRE-family HTH domain